MSLCIATIACRVARRRSDKEMPCARYGVVRVFVVSENELQLAKKLVFISRSLVGIQHIGQTNQFDDTGDKNPRDSFSGLVRMGA